MNQASARRSHPLATVPPGSPRSVDRAPPMPHPPRPPSTPASLPPPTVPLLSCSRIPSFRESALPTKWVAGSQRGHSSILAALGTSPIWTSFGLFSRLPERTSRCCELPRINLSTKPRASIACSAARYKPLALQRISHDRQQLHISPYVFQRTDKGRYPTWHAASSWTTLGQIAG